MKYVILSVLFLVEVKQYGIAQKIVGLPKYHLQVKNSSQSTDRLLLLTFVKSQDFHSIDSLVDKGIDINEPDVYGNTILSEILIDISDTTIYLITIIRIILDMKLKQTNINILVLKLTEKLQVNLIKLIKKFTDLFDICDINHNKIEPTQLINLIQKIYNNTATPQEIGDLNQMLF